MTKTMTTNLPHLDPSSQDIDKTHPLAVFYLHSMKKKYMSKQKTKKIDGWMDGWMDRKR